MSLSKNVLEAWRWWETARDDLQAAETLEKFDCYYCQSKRPKERHSHAALL